MRSGSNCTDALRSLSDPVDIQGNAMRLLRQHFDVGWCYYGEIDEAGTIVTILRDAVKEGLPSLVGVS
ncbi:hypothetical protein ANSO36C_43450 [Nostoc cf. commune SO-36]|uniref:Uncharacterized protein n=1 Tax=Nostoc cf. commune SO-36 TaxID=449208 RepID=A0ABM7Z639_NOSCO|nr:hypothetical protein ANSO36C_43450 [Nostoc cf. commune SO-36]